MAESDPARRDHGGPTVLRDIQNLDTPSLAPHTLRFAPAMTALMQAQWRASFPGGHQQEQGGTIVVDLHGRLSIQNVGGERGILKDGSHAFLPKIKIADPKHFKAIGTFHTHPYDRSGQWATGVSFSGGDMGALILGSFILSVVQSGPRLFAYVKTKLSPTYVDKWALHKSTEEEVWMRMKAGQTFSQGSRIMANGHALQFGFASYQGAHGVLTRI